MDDGEGRTIRFLSVDDIIELHGDIIAQTGGEAGILNRGNLEFVVEFVRGQISSLGLDDPFQCTAYIVRGIIGGHPFVDGNKRTGLEAADIFLNNNGFLFNVTTEEGVQFSFRVARGEMDLQAIRNWLEDHSGKS